MARSPSVEQAAIRDDGIALDEPIAAAVAARPPIRSDAWAAKRHTRDLDRKLRRTPHFHVTSFQPQSSDGARLRQHDSTRTLSSHFDSATPSINFSSSKTSPAVRLPARRSVAGQIVSWLIVVLGALTLTAGVSILGWSLNAQEFQHWNLAISLSLGGQGTLILGLVLVVSRLWKNSRYAVNKLQDVHARLAQLQNTADALAGGRPGGAPNFYAELVRGASPQILLGNLKGQLDQLAARLGQ